MKNVQTSDELIDLGAISAETRGLEKIGLPDHQDGESYGFGGITADD